MIVSEYFVNYLNASHRADSAGRALAAGLDCTKLHGESRLCCHIHGFVKHNNAPMTDHGADFGELLVVEWHVQLMFGNVRAQGAADLNGANWPTGCGAAAEVVNKFPKRQAKRFFNQPAAFDVACKLKRQCAFRSPWSKPGITFTTEGNNVRHRCERDDIIDNSRLAK